MTGKVTHNDRKGGGPGGRGPAPSIAQSKEEILQLISALAPGPRPARPTAPLPATARLELQRWREAFYRDAVADRLTSLCTLLEERLDVLEDEVIAAAPTPTHAEAVAPPVPSPAPLVPLRGGPDAAAGGPHPIPDAAAGGPRPIPDGASLSGRIQEGVLADVLQMLSANMRTGRFIITHADVTAQLWFQDGEIRHAVAGDLAGEDAFFAVIANVSGTFAFVEDDEPAPAHTISDKTQFLILEGLRKMDEEGNAGALELSGEHPP